MQPYRGSSVFGNRQPEQVQQPLPTLQEALALQCPPDLHKPVKRIKRHPAQQLLRLAALKVQALHDEIDELTNVTAQISSPVTSCRPTREYQLLCAIDKAAQAAKALLEID